MIIEITPTCFDAVHHLQGVYKLCELKLLLKYNIVVCRYDKTW